MRTLSIIAPGIECKFTDNSAVNINTACSLAQNIIDRIAYEEESAHDVMAIHGDDGSIVAEVYAKDKSGQSGFSVDGKWYCLPDAADVVTNMISDYMGGC